MRSRISAALLLAAALCGCSTDKKADAAQPAAAREGSVPPRPTVVSEPSQPYRPVMVSGGAKLAGTVDFNGAFPRDSVIALPPGHPGCGQSVTHRVVDHSGTRIGGAVVWLADIRTGKPLPIHRRFELRNENCQLVPRVQAVFAPGTLNVASEDVALHRNRIINVGTGQPEGIAPFNDNGEIIPFDQLLDKPKQLEITCELHPWAKAWILVFDHPYFAVTSNTGAFSIDDVPAGTYRVKAWHPALGVTEQSMTFAAGQSATIGLQLAAAAPVQVESAADSVRAN